MRNVSHKNCRENKKNILCWITFFFFRKSGRLWDMWKNIVQPGSPQMTVWRMRIECRIPKAARMLSEYVILLFHSKNGCTNAPRRHVIRILVFACPVVPYIHHACPHPSSLLPINEAHFRLHSILRAMYYLSLASIYLSLLHSWPL
jgi:hypothetical protein